MNETEIIQGARGHLSDPKRWHKGNYASDDGGRVCMLGALGLASEQKHVSATCTAFGTPLGQAMDLLQLHIPESFFDIPRFNDAESTTHEDVLNVFDKCLADLGGLG